MAFMHHAAMMSPVGRITISAESDRILRIRIGGEIADAATTTPVLRLAVEQLDAWFARRLTHFDLPLAPSHTPRGPAHRAAIAAIPYGETASYGALARTLGSSPRAVGQACRSNPFPIVIPCHRVLAQGGSIGHYTGGDGILTKRWLLNHEAGEDLHS